METVKEILEELKRCQDSPYYFATKYIRVKTIYGEKPYTTILTEKEFNEKFRKLKLKTNKQWRKKQQQQQQQQ